MPTGTTSYVTQTVVLSENEPRGLVGGEGPAVPIDEEPQGAGREPTQPVLVPPADATAEAEVSAQTQTATTEVETPTEEPVASVPIVKHASSVPSPLAIT